MHTGIRESFFSSENYSGNDDGGDGDNSESGYGEFGLSYN